MTLSYLITHLLDPEADGITFTFKGNGEVKVSSHFSLYNFDSVTQAFNIHRSAQTRPPTILCMEIRTPIILSLMAVQMSFTVAAVKMTMGLISMKMVVRLNLICDWRIMKQGKRLDFGIFQLLVLVNLERIYSADQTTLIVTSDDYTNQIIKVDGLSDINQNSIAFGGEGNDTWLQSLSQNPNPSEINPKIEGTNGGDELVAFGDPYVVDSGSQYITKDLEIRGYEGNDKIAGGAGNDYLDGGENAGEVPSGPPSWGQANRDVDDNGKLVMDRLFYIDATSGNKCQF